MESLARMGDRHGARILIALGAQTAQYRQMATVPLTAPAPYNGGIRRLCGRLNVIARNRTRELLIRRGFHDIGNRLVHEGEALHTLIIASVKLLLGHALVLRAENSVQPGAPHVLRPPAQNINHDVNR